MAAILFATGTVILIIGLLWFHIVRPMLEDFGLITVNDYEDAPPIVMSRSATSDAPSVPSSLETDGQTDRQTPQVAAPRAEQLLTLYKIMRAAGISRDEAQAAFKEAGLPLNNNVWKLATPKMAAPSDDDDVLVTPYAGRRTRASYYPDEPSLEFQPPS